MTAQFVKQYDGSARAQFIQQYGSVLDIQIVTAIDAGNCDPDLCAVDYSGEFPVITLDVREATRLSTIGSGWRHILVAIDGAEGERPIFKINRATMDRNTATIPTGYIPSYTTDFITWVQAPSRSLVGGATGTIDCQFTDPLPAGRIFFGTSPIGRQADSATFAEELLDYAAGSPAASADINGVFSTSPTEVDEDDRAIGAHAMYAIKLAWGGATTDGGPKRKLVMLAGIHAAGEHSSWLSFVSCIQWMLDDASTAAQDFRSNWDVWLYFNVNPNGIFGGQRRQTFRSAVDPNRDFIDKALAEIAALTTAVESDVPEADAMFSWHGANSSSYTNFSGFYATSPNQQTLDFIDIGGTVFGVTPTFDVGSSTADSAWGSNVLGATVSLSTEIWQRTTNSQSYYETIGENWAKTLQLADADGLFYALPTLSAATLINLGANRGTPRVTVTY